MTGSLTRIDPYENFLFRLKQDGHYVAAFSKVSALTRATQAVRHREGAASIQVTPGQTSWTPITLAQGVTDDVGFRQWATRAQDARAAKGAPGQELPLKDFRKTVELEVYDVTGLKVMAYTIYNAWVSSFTAMPELDANGNDVAIESMTIEHEGWERDTSVKAPQEPTFVGPSS